MKKFGNVLWGIILIIIGLIIGGNALGITNINIFFDGWWTLFIIIPCFIGLLKEDEKTGNLIGLLIGVALLLACQDILDFDLIWKLAFPAILVAIGLSIIFRDALGGKVSILSGNINELNLDMGVGKFEVTSVITGNSKINAGIGNLELNIQDNKENYTIKADKGIGSIKIDGKEVADDVTYGDGENTIKIDGGIGEIKIDFMEENHNEDTNSNL